MLNDELFDEAIHAARASPNRIRKVGAVLVPAGGGARMSACNIHPRGVRDLEERHGGNGRFIWMEHAERNVIYAAARGGVATEGASLATTFFPCTDCARAIVQSGIAHVYTLPPDFADPVWGESFVSSQVILQEGGVALHFCGRDPAEVHESTMRADAGR